MQLQWTKDAKQYKYEIKIVTLVLYFMVFFEEQNEDYDIIKINFPWHVHKRIVNKSLFWVGFFKPAWIICSQVWSSSSVKFTDSIWAQRLTTRAENYQQTLWRYYSANEIIQTICT